MYKGHVATKKPQESFEKMKLLRCVEKSSKNSEIKHNRKHFMCAVKYYEGFKFLFFSFSSKILFEN